MIRSIISIISGYIAWMGAVWILWALSGYDMHDLPPTGFFIFSVFCESILGLGSGYLTGVIAKRHVLRHSMVLAAFLAIGGVVSIILKTGQESIWIPLVTLFIISPCVALGGYIRKGEVESFS